MKKSSYWKRRYGYLCTVMLALLTLCIAACKDNEEQEDGAFDPSKPLVITDFMPKKGGYGSNLILHGNNFGNDLTKLKVTVGGKQANIINVKNQSLYCVIPQKAYDGDIQVSVYDDNGEEIAYVEAEGTFKYEKKWLVTTFIGQRYENPNDEVEKEGALNDCGCIKSPYWFSFDPKSDSDNLYLTTHATKLCRLIDLKEERVSFLKQFNSLNRPAFINWTVDENKDLVMSDDNPNDGNVNHLFSRSSGFTTSTPLAETGKKNKSLTGSLIHPVNGELYFTTYNEQEIYRYDFETKTVTKPIKHLRTKETLRLAVHPTGKYAYLMRFYYASNNSGYIARMDYNFDTKCFTEPYIVCGTDGSAGYEDGVGDKVRMKGPGQGVFVKNPAYEGEPDEYDYYFCDDLNHCIRILTPYGRVSTFAGRGNGIATGGYADGELRTEARFNRPWAITYDEKRNCFYVGDSENKVIRKIAQEE